MTDLKRILAPVAARTLLAFGAAALALSGGSALGQEFGEFEEEEGYESTFGSYDTFGEGEGYGEYEGTYESEGFFGGEAFEDEGVLGTGYGGGIWESDEYGSYYGDYNWETDDAAFNTWYGESEDDWFF